MSLSPRSPSRPSVTTPAAVEDSVDPWDEPAPTSTDAPAGEPAVAEPEPAIGHHPGSRRGLGRPLGRTSTNQHRRSGLVSQSSRSPSRQRSPPRQPSRTRSTPGTEPAPTSTDAPAGEPVVAEPEPAAVTAPAAVEDETEAEDEEAPASDVVEPEPSELGPTKEPKAATGFTGDPALLDEPDPWD